MTHLEELIKMRQRMSQEILNYFKLNGIKLILFKTPFTCLLPLEDMLGDVTSIGSHIAKIMWDNGEIEGPIADTDEESIWNLVDLDTAETAHILDQLEAGNYKVLNPDTDYDNWRDYNDWEKNDLDPAGGHSLGSHI